jgi:hypothetical protein
VSYAHPPDFSQTPKNPTHSANFGAKLAEHLNELGVQCELKYPDSPVTALKNGEAFVIDCLKV